MNLTMKEGATTNLENHFFIRYNLKTHWIWVQGKKSLQKSTFKRNWKVKKFYLETREIISDRKG